MSSCSSVPTTLTTASTFTMSVTLHLRSAVIELARTAKGIDVKPGSVPATLSLPETFGNIPDASIPMTGTVTASRKYIDLSAIQTDLGGVSLGSSSSAT